MEMGETGHETELRVGAAVAQRARELVGLDQLDHAVEVRASRDHLLRALISEWAHSGLHTTGFEAPVSAIYSAIEEKRPLLTLTKDGEPWFLLESTRGRFRIEDPRGEHRWVEPRRLAEYLGLTGVDTEHSWVALDNQEQASVALSPGRSPWKNALVLLRGEGSTLRAIVLYAVCIGIFSLAIPLTVQAVVNTVAFGQLVQPLVVLTMGLSVGLMISSVLKATQAWVVEMVQRRLLVRLVSQLADRLPRMQIAVFERGDGPELVNRFFDIFIAQKSITALLLGGIEATLIALVGIVVLAFYHPALLAFGTILLGAFALIFGVLGIGGTRTTIAESKSKYALAAWLEELTRHLFLLKSPRGRRFSRDHLDRLTKAWLRDRSSHYGVYFRQLVAGFAVQALAHAALLGLGGWLVLERSLTLGQLVAAELIVAAVIASLAKLVEKLDSAYDLVASADKLASLLGLPTENPLGSDRITTDNAPVAVEFRDVTVKERGVFDFHLAVKWGAVVGIKGNLATTRTINDLIYGFATPDRGEIYLNGQDIRDVALDEVRSFVSVVRQAEILPGTIADNLSATAPGPVSASRIWSVLAQVGLSERVRAIPKGLHAVLAPSGAPLEPVEALKLTLARAILGEPPVLVLDGFLDSFPETERERLLARIRENRSLIVLTCEARVLALCDAATELQNGIRGVVA